MVTVVRNRPDALVRTLGSVRSQGRDIEHVVVDGASTDGTLDVIRGHEAQIDRWISEPDRGIYDAMNKGVRLATGAWVHFLNAGDVFSSADVCREASESLEGHTPFFYGGIRLCRAGVQDDIAYPPSVGRAFFRHHMINHQAMFCSRSALLRWPFDVRLRIAADLDWVLRVLAGGVLARSLPRVVCDVEPGGVSEGGRRLLERFRVQSRHLGLAVSFVELVRGAGVYAAAGLLRCSIGQRRYYALRARVRGS